MICSSISENATSLVLLGCKDNKFQYPIYYPGKAIMDAKKRSHSATKAQVIFEFLLNLGGIEQGDVEGEPE